MISSRSQNRYHPLNIYPLVRGIKLTPVNPGSPPHHRLVFQCRLNTVSSSVSCKSNQTGQGCTAVSSKSLFYEIHDSLMFMSRYAISIRKTKKVRYRMYFLSDVHLVMVPASIQSYFPGLVGRQTDKGVRNSNQTLHWSWSRGIIVLLNKVGFVSATKS